MTKNLINELCKGINLNRTFYKLRQLKYSSQSSFLVHMLGLFLFKVLVGLFDDTIESLVQVLPIRVLYHLLHEGDEFLCDHEVDPQTEKGDCLVGFLEVRLFDLYFLDK